MSCLFVYGTLMCSDILRAVSGIERQAADALLRGYRRHAVRDEDYPGIVEAGDAEVRGRLIDAIPASAWMRLDAFEGNQYARQQVRVALAEGDEVVAWTYVFRPEHRSLLAAADWADTTAPASDRDCAPEFVLLDESFHVALAAAAGNHSLVEHRRRVNERIRLVRMHDFLTVDRVARTIAEHRAIVATLLDGRPDAAARALAGHLDVSERVVGERAAAAVGRMLRGGGS